MFTRSILLILEHLVTSKINLKEDACLNKKRTVGLTISITFIISAFCLPVAHMNSQENRPDYKNPRLPVERRVADLLSRMTLEEKVAQLTCLWANRPQVNPQTDFATDRGDFSPSQSRRSHEIRHRPDRATTRTKRSTRRSEVCQRRSEMVARKHATRHSRDSSRRDTSRPHGQGQHEFSATNRTRDHMGSGVHHESLHRRRTRDTRARQSSGAWSKSRSRARCALGSH